MSYLVSIAGYGAGRQAMAEGDLKQALGRFDAGYRTFSDVSGSFLNELAGQRYKEVDGGVWTWVVSWSDASGRQKDVSGSIDKVRPGDGDQVRLNYVFIPTGGARPGPAPGYLPGEPPEKPEPDFPEYEIRPPEEYSEPVEVTYGLETVEEEEEQETYDYERQELPVLEYDSPSLELPHTHPPSDTYSVTSHSLSRTPNPSPAHDVRFQRELERFLMELLSRARFESLMKAVPPEAAPSVSLPAVAVPGGRV